MAIIKFRLIMKTRAYNCPHEDCYKSFRSPESLDDHVKLHESSIKRDPRDFTCPTCNRVLSTKQSLKEHSFTHKDKKTFRCSEVGCGKMFRQNSQLCNHRKLHKLEKIKRQAVNRQRDSASPHSGRPSKISAKKSDFFTDLILPAITCPQEGASLPSFCSIFN